MKLGTLARINFLGLILWIEKKLHCKKYENHKTCFLLSKFSFFPSAPPPVFNPQLVA